MVAKVGRTMSADARTANHLVAAHAGQDEQSQVAEVDEDAAEVSFLGAAVSVADGEYQSP